jgi:hypothetical protein
MGASKPKPAVKVSKARQTIGILLRPGNRGLALAAVVVVASIAGSIYAWQRWGEPSTHSPDYIVTPERIVATPQPAWIHADVKADVVKTADLARLHLRDRKLVEEVASAFALHPWVSKVVQVQKRFPAQIDVHLEYRRPVAAVEVNARSQAGLLFIDGEGVLLPSADFAQSQAKDYLRITAGNETPAGVYGTPWGSERVAGAARVAAAWELAAGSGASGKRWQPLGLYRIVGVRTAGGELVYELRTRKDVRVVWGSPPGHESSDEPSPQQKIAALEQQVADKGPLDREGGPALLDLRDLANRSVKTAGEAARKTR